ncbi:hypothetical protein JCM10599A_63880 [Paraburkholderia kururiensis]
MDGFDNRDELTTIEKRVYKYAAFVLIALSLYLMILIRSGRVSNSIVLNMIELTLLLGGVVFGWGYRKNVRVLDLRRFGR